MKFLIFVFLLFVNICIAQQTDIIWGKPVRVTINGNSITKSQNGQIASAKSENILDANVNGWAEFKVTQTNSRLGFGFINKTSNNNEVDGEIDFANMAYSIQLFNNNSVKIYKEGDLFGQFGSYSVGSVFRIERINNQIKFYKNGVLLTSITNNSIPSKSFVVNGVIQSNSTSIIEGKSSFAKPLTLTSSVVDVHCQSATNLGSISISVSGGIQPYTYSWSNGATSSSLNNIKSGTYSLTVTDASNKLIKQTFTVLNCVDWTDATGVTINGTVLTKTATTSWGNAGAASQNVLQGGSDGFMQYTPGGNTKFSSIGLTFLNTDNDYLSIDYAFLIDHKRLFIFSSGKLQGDFGRLKNTDVLKIERKAETILYYKNDIVIYKEITKPEMDLVVDVALNKVNDYFENVKTSFYSKQSLNVSVKNYEHDDAKGSITISVSGGYPPYLYSFNGMVYPTAHEFYLGVKDNSPTLIVDTVVIKNELDALKAKNNLTDLLPDNYQASVSNAFQEKNEFVAVVGSKIIWALKNGIESKKDVIPVRNFGKQTYYYDSGENLVQSGEFNAELNMAIAENNITKNYNNYLEFTVPDIRNAMYVGLFEKELDKMALEGPDKGFQDLRKKTAFQFTGKGDFLIWFDGSVIYSNKFSSGDVFGMANDIVSGEFNYYVNGQKIISKPFEQLKTETALYLKVLFTSPGARINNLVMKVGPIGPPILLPPTFGFVNLVTKDLTCAESCNGSVDATGFLSGFSIPVKYDLVDLQTGVITTIPYTTTPNHALFTGLCAGKYQVKYLANRITFIFSGLTIIPVLTPVTVVQSFEIGYLPYWTNYPNCSVDPLNASLEKTSGGATLDVAGGSTYNMINQTSSTLNWIDYKVTGNGVVNGLSLSDPDQTAGSVRYGIYTINLFGSRFYLLKNNTSALSIIHSTPLSTASNDLIRIEKLASNLTFKINGVVKGTISGVTTGNYIMDATVQTLNSKVFTPRVSFGCVLPPVYAVLKKELDGTYFQTYDNKLLFTTDGDYSNMGINYSIYNFARVGTSSLPINSSTLKNGDNRYEINITTLSGGYYVLELTNQKKEKLLLRFKK